MRGGRYVPQDLHAFASPSHRGVYWFTGGINYRAFAAWVAATGVGLLFASTSIITGPLTDHVSGIDLSFMSSAIVGGVVYYVLVKVFPEHGVDPNPAAPDLGVPPGVVGA
jgi:cytosine/uracil/thiamine/allantoin permease